MKVLLFSLMILLLPLFLINCSSAKQTGEAIEKQNVSSGQLYITSNGYGSLKSKSVENAVENAFRNLLINGIPESNQSTPLLGGNAQAVFNSHKTYFENFFKNDMMKFVLKKDIVSFNFLNTNSPSSKVDVLIHLAALRAKLENDNIIRKFGI